MQNDKCRLAIKAFTTKTARSGNNLHGTTSVAAIRDIIHGFSSARLSDRLEQHLDLRRDMCEGSIPEVVARVLIEKCCVSNAALLDFIQSIKSMSIPLSAR
jgi:hypothetical protein